MYKHRNRKFKFAPRALSLFLILSFLVAPVGAIDISAIRERGIPVIDSNVENASETMEEGAGNSDGQVGSGGLNIDAKGAVLMDAVNGTVLYEENANKELPPASVTKIMTMLLVMEAIDRGQVTLNDKVTISKRAASMGGSQLFMEEGEQQTLENLIKGMAIASANDACVAAAEYIAGAEEIFIENMNKRAKELGMNNTNFVNTNGLPVANHYTSAYDIGLMGRELIIYETIQPWLTTWMDSIMVGKEGKEKTEIGLTNTNRLIRNYPGATGIKTGFTAEAGYCLAASAEKGDLQLVAVVLGSPSTKVRFSEAARLLDYGFASYDSVAIAKKNDVIGQIPVQKGKYETCNAITSDAIAELVTKGDKDSISWEMIPYENIYAPISKGEAVGEIVTYQSGQEIKRYPLVAEENVESAGFIDIYIKILKAYN